MSIDWCGQCWRSRFARTRLKMIDGIHRGGSPRIPFGPGVEYRPEEPWRPSTLAASASGERARMEVRARIGPGRQNVNKVATAVECRLDLDAARIRGGFRERLERLAGSRLTSGGEIVVFADTHRTQSRNREAALARLAALVEEALPEPRPGSPPARPPAPGRGGGDDKKRRGSLRSSAARSTAARTDGCSAGKPAGETRRNFDLACFLSHGPSPWPSSPA